MFKVIYCPRCKRTRPIGRVAHRRHTSEVHNSWWEHDNRVEWMTMPSTNLVKFVSDGFLSTAIAQKLSGENVQTLRYFIFELSPSKNVFKSMQIRENASRNFRFGISATAEVNRHEKPKSKVFNISELTSEEYLLVLSQILVRMTRKPRSRETPQNSVIISNQHT